jgi:hypothetical protein
MSSQFGGLEITLRDMMGTLSVMIGNGRADQSEVGLQYALRLGFHVLRLALCQPCNNVMFVANVSYRSFTINAISILFILAEQEHL